MLTLRLNREEEKALASVLFAIKEIVSYHNFREGELWTAQANVLQAKLDAASKAGR